MWRGGCQGVTGMLRIFEHVKGSTRRLISEYSEYTRRESWARIVFYQTSRISLP